MTHLFQVHGFQALKNSSHLKYMTLGLIGSFLGVSFSLASFTAAHAAGTTLTVYNQNYAMVTQETQFQLNKGENEVVVDTIPAELEASSVYLKPTQKGKGPVILNQSYRYDTVTSSELLSRLIGMPIRFLKDGVQKTGTLLAPVVSNGEKNTIVVQTAEGVLVTAVDEITLEKLPAGMYVRPTLLWQLHTPTAGNIPLTLSYLTRGIGWEANYLAVLNETDDALDLTAWVAVDNQTQSAFKDVQLKLVAGDVQKTNVYPKAYNMAAPMMARDMVAAGAPEEEAAPSFSENSLGEYHTYTLSAPVTLNAREKKQVQWVAVQQIPVEKHYIFNANQYYAGQGRNRFQGLTTRIVIKNDAAHQLGRPLPKGTIRILKPDSEGIMALVGEDAMKHSPSGETIELTLGRSFDLVGERIQLESHSDTKETVNRYKVSIRNQKAVPVEVEVQDQAWGDWQVIDTDGLKPEKLDANRFQFKVKVPAKGETILNYTVKVKHK